MIESEMTSQEMEEQYLQMFEPSMEERIEKLEYQVCMIPCLEKHSYSKEERIEELEYDMRELQEKVQNLENLLDSGNIYFTKSLAQSPTNLKSKHLRVSTGN